MKTRDAMINSGAIILGIIQALFSAAMLSGMPLHVSTWGTASLGASAILWVIFAIGVWYYSKGASPAYLVVALITTAVGIIAIITTGTYIPILSQIGYAGSMALWTVTTCDWIGDILKS